MTALCSLAGIALLAACGAAAGYEVAARIKQRWRTARAFGRLLEYLASGLRYRAATGGEMLAAAAAYPEFSCLGLQGCDRLALLPVPAVFDPALRRELADDLRALESAPREAAWTLLAQMIGLCRRQERIQEKAAADAARLYPRLGGCLGMMLGVLLM